MVFDLDDTLVDTAVLRSLREARRWKEAVSRVHQTRLFDGVDVMLRQLGEADLAWAIVTTSVSFYADRVIEHHGIAGVVRIAFHDATPKPHPAPVLLALQRMSLPPADAIGVGDAESDLRAYQAAGLRAVGAGWSPVLHPGAWDLVARTPAEILTL